jgi:hypothetical protein
LKERVPVTARSSRARKTEAEKKSDFVELVHPDGERTETPLTSLHDSQLRWNGWLPKEQAKLEAPEPTDSGSSGLTGNEKTEGNV